MRSAVTRTVSVIQLNQHNNVNSPTEHTCSVTNSLVQNMFTNYNSSLLRQHSVNYYFSVLSSLARPVRLATDWTVRGSNTCGGDIFRTRPYQTCGHPSLQYSGHRVIPGDKAAGVWLLPTTSFGAEVKERLQLCLYYPSVPSRYVIG